VSLRAPESVQKLQTALHAKAKEEPSYRFYALYDKLYREDILADAGQPAWIYRPSRASRSTGSSGGWANWRKTSRRRRIAHSRCGAATSPSPTEGG
jgi:hypothetical protein